MRRSFILPLVCLLACLPGAFARDAGGSETPDCVAVTKRDFADEASRSGTFVPALFEEISFWMEEYAGELLLLEALPHGSPVNGGDVVARFDTTSIDRQIELAGRGVKSAELALRNTRDRVKIAVEAAKAARRDADADLREAERAREGWEKHELAFAERDAALRRQYSEHNIADQKDELAQLEAMYRDDELTDATEEIVLKRARRNLARTLVSAKLTTDRRAYTTEFSEPSRTDRMRRTVAARERALKKLVLNDEIDHRSRIEGLEKAELSLMDQKKKLGRLQADRERLVVRASRSGVLLHGSFRDYRPKKTPPRYRRGSRVGTRKTIFTVADPNRFEIALTVPESKLASWHTGLAGKITPVASPGVTLRGTLHVDRFPSASSAMAGENSYDAKITLENPVPGVAAGMRADVTLVVDVLKAVFVLPRTAVFGSGDDAHCFVAGPEGGEFLRVPLTLGPSAGNEIVVYGELETTQKVLLCAPGK